MSSWADDADEPREQDYGGGGYDRGGDRGGYGGGGYSGGGGGYGGGGQDRSALFGSNSGGGSGGGRQPYVEDESTRGMDTRALIQRQDQVMRDQDEGLDLIAKSIARQKQLGQAIGNELDDQNDMLEDLSRGVSNTEHTLKRETGHIVRVSEKAKTGGMLCCIVLLILAIIIVAALPI
eukprot:m.144878 g.144878  ORF g.144878 m.144878 type:complete len:178 (+) comp16776_c1_seq1:125-658(+)